ncbi:LysR family transcriptional regulator [Niveibacterium umoris]|uniref:DNA-binding transcriptional LysR family regulator n=1 Tax=Niveibacterium umoris TaxID=1193620 RepID=A0A840BLR8_9RHOO|nr:LysR family transcriptional regulator [Niveibacterium umoris]MBB4012592.1 DNA-binding transcriptional LysR family regulator [Niveibacterium umoris]
MHNKTAAPTSPDWDLIRAFLAVVDAGSLTAAAGALATSQPTLSRQIAQLEQQTGAALFERTTRGLSLTEAGDALVEPARRMQAAAQALALAAAGRAQTLAGTVRLTASEMMSAHVLPPILVQLRAAHPEIEIELVASNRVDNLLAREADIAIRMVRPDQGSLVTRHVADYPIGFYAHADYLKGRAPVTPDNFAEHDWVGLDQSPQLIDGFRSAGFNIDRHFFAFRCDNNIVGWEAVRAGMGIGITMQRVAERDPQLVRLLQEFPLPSLPVWLTAHRELRGSPRMRIVFDALAEALGD